MWMIRKWFCMLVLGLMVIPFVAADAEFIMGGAGDAEFMMNEHVMYGTVDNPFVTPVEVCENVGKTGEKFGKYFGVIALVSVLGVVISFLVIGWQGGELKPEYMNYLFVVAVIIVSLTLAFVVLSSVPC